MNDITIHTSNRIIEVNVKDIPRLDESSERDLVCVRFTDNQGNTAKIMGTLAGLESITAQMGNQLAEIGRDRHTYTEVVGGVQEAVAVVHNDPLYDLLTDENDAEDDITPEGEEE